MKQWSILIVILFMLIVTSLIGLIMMVYMRSILNFTNSFHDYQQAFYLAQAWVELQLVKAKNHAFWYEDSITTWSKTVQLNITNYCTKSCFFSSTLQSSSYVVWQSEHIRDNQTVCSELLWYTTDTSKLISSLFLYQDETSDSEREWKLMSSKKISAIKNSNIKIMIYGLSSYRLALQATSSSWESSSYDRIQTLNQSEISLLDYQSSFLQAVWDDSLIRIKIINDLKQSWYVCFQSTAGNLKLPSFHQLVQSVWSYWNTTVRIQALQTSIPWDEQDLAGWSI